MDRLSDLEVFVEVVALGDFSKTAKALGVMPSSVSRSIKRLETRLGARLLDRRARFMQPTSEGAALYAVAKPALDAIADGEDLVSGAIKVPEGVLRVQAVPTFGVYRLAPIIPAFKQLYPRIRLEIILEAEGRDIVTSRIDVTISTGLPRQSDLLSKKIGQTARVMCASPDYLARKGRPQSLAELAKHEHLGFMLGSDQRPNNEKNTSLGGYDANIHGADQFGAVVMSNNGAALRRLCLDGMGIARLSDYHVSRDLAEGRLIDLFPGQRKYQNIYALYPQHLRHSARVSVFIDYLQQSVKRHDEA